MLAKAVTGREVTALVAGPWECQASNVLAPSLLFFPPPLGRGFLGEGRWLGMTPWFWACALSEMGGPGEGGFGGKMRGSVWGMVSWRHGWGMRRPRGGTRQGRQVLLSSRVALAQILRSPPSGPACVFSPVGGHGGNHVVSTEGLSWLGSPMPGGQGRTPPGSGTPHPMVQGLESSSNAWDGAHEDAGLRAGGS